MEGAKLMDLKKVISNIAPINIDKAAGKYTEEAIEAVRLYNKALENLHTGSEDIAIIELKRVVSKTPDFTEAVDLLALCYAYTNQLDKAEELVSKVGLHNNVEKASQYLEYFNTPNKNTKSSVTINSGTKSSPAKTTAKKSVTKTAEKKLTKEEQVPAEYMLFKKIFSLFKKPVVALCMSIISIVLLVLSVGFYLKAPSNEVVDNPKDVSAADTTTDTRYNTLVEENKLLKVQIEELNNKLKMQELDGLLTNASSLYNQKKYVQASEILLSMSNETLTGDTEKRYDKLKADVYPKAANQLTNDGVKLYGSKNYTDAIQKLEMVFKLGDKWTFGDKALYSLGKAYADTGETQKSLEAFNKLIKDYPNSTYLKWAQARVNAAQ